MKTFSEDEISFVSIIANLLLSAVKLRKYSLQPTVARSPVHAAAQTFPQLLEATLKSELACDLVRRGYIDRNFSLYAAQFYGQFTGVAERLVVPPELDLRIDDDAARGRIVGHQLQGGATGLERIGEGARDVGLSRHFGEALRAPLERENSVAHGFPLKTPSQFAGGPRTRRIHGARRFPRTAATFRS